MISDYRTMPVGPANSVPISVWEASYPGRGPIWISLVTGQTRVAMQRQCDENRATARLAMKKYRAWRERNYQRSFEAIRLLDLRYLPQVEHPYLPGQLTFDIELPLRGHHGEEVFCAHASSVEELEEVIGHWFAALTLPTRVRESPEEYQVTFTEEAENERLNVANHYVRRIFHEDLPLEQRDALLAAIFRCKWFDIAPSKLRSYFRGVMRRAAAGRYRSAPLKLGGVPATSLDAPLPDAPGTLLRDVLADPSSSETQGDGDRADQWQVIWEFTATLPPSKPKLQKMCRLLIDLRDEEAAVRGYGRGGSAQLKRLKREMRAWLGERKEASR